MTKPKTLLNPWLGSVAIKPGMGAFHGESGDNKPHKHWAHQIVIGLDASVEVMSGETRCERRGLWIPAGVTHQLKLSRVLCIYIDPNLDVCNALLPYIKNPSKRSIRALEEDFITECLSRFTGTENLLIALKAFERQYRGSKPSGPKSRLSDVLEALNAEASRGRSVSRAELAKMVCLSPSHFSHWFTECTGLPLRSYRKWLKLLTGFELSREMSLTDAAIASGFSDQAHFCRSVTEAFGVSPTVIQRLLSK